MRTRLMQIGRVFSLALALGLVLAIPASAGTIVIPAGFATVEGNAQAITALSPAARTVQLAYAPAALTGLNEGDQITGLAFRMGGGYPSWPNSAVTFATYYIKLSQSQYPPNALSDSVAANIGPDVVTVYSGTLTFPPNSFPGGATPNAFGPVINFTTPYVYSGGILLVTISHTGGGVSGGFADADGSAPNLANARYATSYNATTVPGWIYAPIIQLTIGSSGYTLQTDVAGNGMVTRVPDLSSYPAGTPVTLTAVADPGYTFAGWSGDCAGQGDCALTMNANKVVTATFEARNSKSNTINITTPGAYAFGGDICGSIYFTNTGTVPNPQITVTLNYTYPSTSYTGLQRQYKLETNAADYEAAVTLCYEQAELDWAGITDEMQLHAYRYKGTVDWQEYSVVDPLANTVTAYGVEDLGVFGLGVSSNPPTAVVMSDLVARSTALPVWPFSGLLLLGAAVIIRRQRR